MRRITSDRTSRRSFLRTGAVAALSVVGRTPRWRSAAVTSVGSRAGAEIIEGFPSAPAGHRGLTTLGGVRNRLCRGFPRPQFHHFAVDMAGERLISDYEKAAPQVCIYIARLGRPGLDALTDFRCVARPRPSGAKTSHMHPFLSPDGRLAFFNSDESGLLQAYMIRGLAG